MLNFDEVQSINIMVCDRNKMDFKVGVCVKNLLFIFGVEATLNISAVLENHR